jgi:TolB-like protein
MDDRTYSFGRFNYDCRRKLLLKQGAPIHIGQRGTALLEALLAADGKAVSKSALMEAAWHSEHFEESNLTVQIAALRKMLGQTVDGDDWIKTVQRVGYQLIVPEQTQRTSFFAGVPDRPLPSAGKPSIAVLPFANLSADAQHGYFADALTEDLIAALARVREFFVISRNTSFSYKNRTVSTQQLAHELGIEYVLEGTVQVSGQQIRVTAQLVNGQSGASISSERFEGKTEDVFALQDEITRSIALAMQVKLSYGELARLWDGQTKNLRAWENMAQARDCFLCFDSVNVRLAQTALKEALEIDPHYTGAMIQLGLCHWWQARYDTSVDRELSLRLCEDQVQRVLTINPQMGGAYMLLGGNAFLRDQHDEAIALCEKAVELSPSDSWVLAYLGLVCIYGGNISRAIEVLKSALRLCPFPIGWYIESYAMAHMWSGDLSTAQAAAEEFQRIDPDDLDALVLLATVYGFKGMDEDAKRMVSIIRTKYPAYCLKDTVRTERYKVQAMQLKVVATLRNAGVPE